MTEPTRPVRLIPSVPILALLAVAAMVFVGCPAENQQTSEVARPVSLVAQWSDIQIENPVPTPHLPAEGEIVFDGGTQGATWKALQGVENLRVEDGRLVGRTSSEQPAILIELPQSVGGGDELWSVETRIEVSGGTRMGVHPVLDPGPPMPANLARIEEWPLSSPLLPGSGTKTYTTELDDVFLLEMMPATREPRRVLLRPTNAAGAEFAVDSLRLVFRGEHMASIESGPGWHGLGEVFRESLVSRPGETLVFETELPARPWLDLAVGAAAAGDSGELPRFEVAVAAITGDATGATTGAEMAATLQPESADSWQPARIDLSKWAGKAVQLRLRSAVEGRVDAPSFWGAPTVRDALPGAAESEAAATETPQAVVLFLADTLRRDHLDAWGHDRETAPTIARLAAEGVRFEDAVAQSTWTKVSVSSILTSLYPSTSGVADLSDRISAGETTIAEVFRGAGYATFATSSVPFTGQLTNLHQGVEVLYEFGAAPRGDEVHPTQTSQVWIDAYLEWLELHRDVPTFAFVHVMDPHSPFKPKPPYDTMWASEQDAELFAEQAATVEPLIEQPLMRRFMAPTQEELAAAGVDAEIFVETEKSWYDGSIRAMDAEIARMMARITELGLGERTLLAFVSDHGEEFLEHGRHWHGNTVYGEVANVPMALWGAGVPGGLVVDRTVQAIDLYPTLVEMAGLEVPERTQGRSLVPLLKAQGGADGTDVRQRPAFVELPGGRPGTVSSYAVIDGRWKLVWNRVAGDADGGDSETRDSEAEVTEYELYDHEADPLNLAEVSADHPDEVERLAEQLDRWRSWAEEQKLDESQIEAEMSAEELEQLRSLGYVE